MRGARRGSFGPAAIFDFARHTSCGGSGPGLEKEFGPAMMRALSPE